MKMKQTMWQQTRTIFFGLVSIVAIFAQWAWAKLRGRDFDNGMDA